MLEEKQGRPKRDQLARGTGAIEVEEDKAGIVVVVGRGEQYYCWGEGKDATLRSRPSLQPLVRRRQSGQGHPSQDSTP